MILDDIVKNTREELVVRKAVKPLEALKVEVRALPRAGSGLCRVGDAACRASMNGRFPGRSDSSRDTSRA